MRRWNGAVLALLLAAAAACADPPVCDIPAQVTAPPSGYLTARPTKTDAASVVYVSPGLDPFPSDLLTDKTVLVVPVRGLPAGTYPCWAVASSKTGEQRVVTFAVVVPGPPAPPPAPPGPTPPAPGPAPSPTDPVTSFRVVVVYESGDSLTAPQRAVVYGKAVEDWLTANCTGGAAGWRRRDKDAPGDADPTMAALWAAVRPKVTVTPCLAVERNGKVDIIPLGATPDAMLTTLKTYRGK